MPVESVRTFSLFPESASNFSGSVDGLYLYLILLSAFFSLLIGFLIVYFAVKYRHKGPAIPKPADEHSIGGMVLEIVWSVIPLGLSMVIFVWGAVIFFGESRPPTNAMEVFVTGKQWMWKIQHNEGAREINELHVPVNQNIRLTLTSEDVIHDFFVPAFRTKTDVLPGKYTTEWFRPTKIGVYQIFCAEYCGTKHSGMIGKVYVMSQEDFDKWLAAGSGEGSMAEQGQALFNQLGCGTCHPSVLNQGNGRCPNLNGLFGTTVVLKDGTRVKADESYIRESILYPQSKIVGGYEDIMPTFKGLISEDGMLKLVEYVKSMGPAAGMQNTATPAAVQSTGNSGAPGTGPGSVPNQPAVRPQARPGAVPNTAAAPAGNR